MLNYFEEKNEPSFTIKNRIFRSMKNRIFFKGVNPCFLAKKCHFFLYLDLLKIRIEVRLSDFAEKKETFLTLKMPIFGYLDLVKI